LVLYVLSAVVAALATSWTVMVAARFVWGLGAAGPRSLSVAMVRDRYSGDAMARLMSVIMAVFLLVPILAPAVGAGLIAVLPWRAVYWLPAVVAIALLVWTRRLPETLTPERRRPFTVAAVGTACREVVSNRQTRAFTVAMTFLFGVMTTYLAGSEIVVGEVFGYGEWFPAFFGVIAVLLAILTRLVRRMSQVGVLTAWILVAVSLSAGGRPNFWLFTIALAGVIPVAQGLVPNCNTAAMQPLPHVAGTASAVIGTVTTAGGALLGGLAASAFDGTVRPFALAIAIFISIASALILLVATERA
jgi:DHA1 family bicyclomycin/chloramphenicol resistance-like MFS transporter